MTHIISEVALDDFRESPAVEIIDELISMHTIQQFGDLIYNLEMSNNAVTSEIDWIRYLIVYFQIGII